MLLLVQVLCLLRFTLMLFISVTFGFQPLYFVMWSDD